MKVVIDTRVLRVIRVDPEGDVTFVLCKEGKKELTLVLFSRQIAIFNPAPKDYMLLSKGGLIEEILYCGKEDPTYKRDDST